MTTNSPDRATYIQSILQSIQTLQRLPEDNLDMAYFAQVDDLLSEAVDFAQGRLD